MSQTLVTILGFYLAFGALELLFPAERGQDWRGRIRNALITLLLIITGAIFLAMIIPLIPIRVTQYPTTDIGTSIAIIFASLFLTDLLFYWYHRAQHRFHWFWSIHELHHSDTALNVTSSLRSFWLERPLQATFIVLPIHYTLGTDATASLIAPFVFTGWLFFTHANLKLSLGPLTPIFTGPQLHRVHHSILPEHQRKNYAQFFPVLDILFGTYYQPQKNEFPPTGTPSLTTRASLRDILIKPFHDWLGMAKKKQKTLS